MAEASIQKANEALSSLVAALQKRDAELTLLSRMNELLQTCESQEEAYRVIALTAVELFVERSGCLAVLHPSGQYLETVARWGDETLMEDVFSMEDCWALRRGRPHEVIAPRTSLICSHFVRPPDGGYRCLPLTVQGETLGVFHLDVAPTTGTGHHDSQLQLAVAAGEAIKLTLTNLRLRKKLHDAGDLVLRESSRVLREKLCKSDIACRYGGEEFLLVLPDSSIGDTSQRLEQLRLHFENMEIRHDGKLLATMTFSAGIAGTPEHGSTAEELLRAADDALYTAKQAGRNRVLAYRAPD